MSHGANHVLFKDRSDAGRLLAERLTAYVGNDTLILGIPRGGAITAKGMAHMLGLPSDILVVEKIPSPTSEEYDIGAVAPGGIIIIRWKSVQRSGADEDWVKLKVGELSESVKKSMHMYRNVPAPLSVTGRTVILVDDGSAPGVTMEAAVLWARKKNARRIVAALPVASSETAAVLKPEVTELVVLQEISSQTTVGDYYASFAQISDAEVIQSLL